LQTVPSSGGERRLHCRPTRTIHIGALCFHENARPPATIPQKNLALGVSTVIINIVL
jgi:hypothetical protein